MKNFVFISPHFPNTYWRFVQGLVKNGFRVLGIGDCPYDQLSNELKQYLTEYYACYNMNDFEEEAKAVAYFENKYGHIDYLESNNEYWLQRDAWLRDRFNITTGVNSKEIEIYQHKSMMKACFQKAGVKTAKYILVDTYENLKKFADEVGFPIFAKPDRGVGAAGDYKIKNLDDLNRFFNERDPNVPYIVEQFVTGNIVSFDGVSDSQGNVLFATSEFFPPSIADILQQQLDVFYYCLPKVPDDLAEIGPRVIKAFNVRNRFFHIEFFRLSQDIKGLGKKNEIVALETNMRPPGGYTPDLLNFANSVNCYQIWADSMAFDENRQVMTYPKFYAGVASRRFKNEYFYSDEDIARTFRDNLCATGVYPPILADCMGDKYYMAKFWTLEELKVFEAYVARRVGEPVNDIKTEKIKDNKEPICDTHVDGA